MPKTRTGFTLSICPNCGSPEIQSVRQDWTSTFQGEKYTVRALEHYSCPTCGEKVYPPEAMQRIQEASPAYLKAVSRRTGSRSRHAA